MNRNIVKKHGRRVAGSWGRPKKERKRAAHKAERRFTKVDNRV